VTENPYKSPGKYDKKLGKFLDTDWVEAIIILAVIYGAFTVCFFLELL